MRRTRSSSRTRARYCSALFSASASPVAESFSMLVGEDVLGSARPATPRATGRHLSGPRRRFRLLQQGRDGNRSIGKIQIALGQLAARCARRAGGKNLRCMAHGEQQAEDRRRGDDEQPRPAAGNWFCARGRSLRSGAECTTVIQSSLARSGSSAVSNVSPRPLGSSDASGSALATAISASAFDTSVSCGSSAKASTPPRFITGRRLRRRPSPRSQFADGCKAGRRRQMLE